MQAMAVDIKSNRNLVVNNMKHYVCALFLLFGVVLSFNAAAIGGITSADNFDPTQDIEDMRVKVLGGYVRITRTWENGQWVWNKRWAPAVVDSALSMKRNGINYRYSHVENGKMIFEDRSGKRFITDPWSWKADAPSVSIQWQGRDGNIIFYDAVPANAPASNNLSSVNGRYTANIQGYQDKNGVKVSFDKDTYGHITHIRDNHGNVVVTLEWSGAMLQSITDYAGRKVLYHYASDNKHLAEVVDVLGQTWGYTYKTGNARYVAQTSPEGAVTSFSPPSSVSFASGNVVETSSEYDDKTQLSHLTEVHSTGKVIETWSNVIGEVVRKVINGEEQFRADYVLSDESVSVDLIKRAYSQYALGLHGLVSFDGSAGFKYCVLIGGWANPAGYANSTIYGNATNFAGCTFSPDYCYPAPGNYTHETCTYAPESTTLVAHLPDALDPIPYVKQKIVTDARGNKTTYFYDQWKNEVKVVYADGSSISKTWHEKFALPLTETNEKGVVTAYEYDDKGNLLTLIEAKGTPDERTTRYTYDEFGQLKTETTGESVANNTELATTSYDYDQYGNVTKITDPEGNVTQFKDYDALGMAAKAIDGRSSLLPVINQYTWTLNYDAAGNLLSSFDPYGKGETYSYSAAGHLDSIQNASGSKLIFTTNANGQPLTVTDGNQNVTKLEYDKANRIASVTDANGNKNKLLFDDRGRVSKIIDGESNATTFGYADNLLRTVQYPTYKEVVDYDHRNQIKQSSLQANAKNYIRKLGYDLSGNLNLTTDAQNKETKYDYDDLGRVIKTTDPKGGETLFSYDARDNLLQVTDPEGRVTRYTYDKNDQLLTEAKADDQVVRQNSYDENGNVIAFINPEQEQTKNYYDLANRLVKSEVYANKGDAKPIKVINYQISDKDLLTSWSQQLGSDLPEGVQPTPDIIPLSETYTYTNLDQLESVTVNYGAFSKTYSYSYYPNGLKKTYTNPEGAIYTYYYNKNNQLIAVHIPGQGQISYTAFSWMQPQTLLLPGGLNVTYSYDDFQKIKSQLLKGVDGQVLASEAYDYDLEHNLVKRTTDLGAYNYGYDALYQLTSAQAPSDSDQTSETFDYDGVGNRVLHTQGEGENAISANLAYNSKNQLESSATGETYTYNVNGHTATRTRNGVVTEFIYNHEERLIAVKQNNTLVASYAYNPRGQRVSKTVNGETTWYLYNANGMAAEYSATGALIKEYHFNPQMPWMTDPQFMRTADGKVYYYRNDQLGTPQQLLDASGQIVWAATYSAFGKASISKELVENNLRFPGQYFDAETGLHYNYFRDYDPEAGRYVQSDPIGMRGGVNTYLYTGNNPVNYGDPTGQYVQVIIWTCLRFRACQAAAAAVIAYAWCAITKSCGNSTGYPSCPDSSPYPGYPSFYDDGPNSTGFPNVNDSPTGVPGYPGFNGGGGNPGPANPPELSPTTESPIPDVNLPPNVNHVPAPPNLPAFPDASPAKPKTPVQGGGGFRKRWKDSDGNIYEWDYQHGRVEKYNKNGKHIGEFNPVTGEQTKPAKKGRKVEK